MDYYKILGLEKNASADDIKKAYRTLANKHHPDKGGNEEEFKKIAEAYETLSDSAKKANYDRPKNQSFGGFGDIFGGGGFGGFDINDLFGGFGGFNGGQQYGQQRAAPLSISINIELVDTLRGNNKTIRYNRDIQCTPCNGVGGKDIINCATCNGQGRVNRVQQTNFGAMSHIVECNVCSGQGKIIKNKCSTCSGSGKKNVTEEINVNIPIGITDDLAFEIEGKGSYVKNVGYGNLRISVKTNMNGFIRDGENLVKNINLNIIDALLGCDISVDGIDTKLNINIPTGTNNNDIINVKRGGLPNVNNNSRVGDLLLKVSIKTPKNLTTKEKELLNELRKQQNFNI